MHSRHFIIQVLLAKNIQKLQIFFITKNSSIFVVKIVSFVFIKKFDTSRVLTLQTEDSSEQSAQKRN